MPAVLERTFAIEDYLVMPDDEMIQQVDVEEPAGGEGLGGEVQVVR